MYAAKRARSGCGAYDPQADDAAPGRLALLGDLRRGLEEGALVLHYQPKLELATGRVEGVEALARWAHPTRGLLPPQEFVPLAEQTALAGPLTLQVLEAALRQCRAWREAGRELTVAVNVPPPCT